MSVLISTYWNVNVGAVLHSLFRFPVLISTYWNVNIVNGISMSSRIQRFNLNLLECKSFITSCSSCIYAF